MSPGLLILGIVLFISLIVVHEYGHFVMARRGGVGIKEFGIFFPPRLYKHRTKGGWDFTINLIPLGGFVSLQGEQDDASKPGDYGAASLWVKSKITAAGVVMNLIVAFLLLTLLAVIGMPKLVPNQFTVKSDTKISRQEVLITDIEPNSPASKTGIQDDDELVALGPVGHLQPANNADTLPNVTKHYAGQTIEVVYKHKGKTHMAYNVQLRTAAVVNASQKTNNPKGYLGIYPTAFTLQRSTWSAPIVAGGLIGQFTGLTFEGLGHALAGLGGIIAGVATHNTTARQNGQTSASSQVSGPVGIFVVMKYGSLLGLQFMLFIIALISLTLAIMNFLPIPALDGGRFWITLVARGIFKKSLSQRLEIILASTGFVVLISLSILITIVDIHRFF